MSTSLIIFFLPVEHFKRQICAYRRKWRGLEPEKTSIINEKRYENHTSLNGFFLFFFFLFSLFSPFFFFFFLSLSFPFFSNFETTPQQIVLLNQQKNNLFHVFLLSPNFLLTTQPLRFLNITSNRPWTVNIEQNIKNRFMRVNIIQITGLGYKRTRLNITRLHFFTSPVQMCSIWRQWNPVRAQRDCRQNAHELQSPVVLFSNDFSEVFVVGVHVVGNVLLRLVTPDGHERWNETGSGVG